MLSGVVAFYALVGFVLSQLFTSAPQGVEQVPCISNPILVFPSACRSSARLQEAIVPSLTGSISCLLPDGNNVSHQKPSLSLLWR